MILFVHAAHPFLAAACARSGTGTATMLGAMTDLSGSVVPGEKSPSSKQERISHLPALQRPRVRGTSRTSTQERISSKSKRRVSRPTCGMAFSCARENRRESM